MKYKILYIDDERSDFLKLKRDMGEYFEIEEGFTSGITLETLIPILDERDFDFLIVDSNLNDKTGCGFNGKDVLQYFTKKYPHFPVMLFTNYDDQAVAEIDDFDLNKIYSKRQLLHEKDREVLIQKINKIIKTYEDDIKEAEEKITKIIEKKKEGKDLTAQEEDEAIELDTFLDEILDGSSPLVPQQLKASNEEKIDQLLNKTDDLINKLKKYEKV